MNEDSTILDLLEELAMLDLHESHDAVQNVTGAKDLHIRLTDLPAKHLVAVIVGIFEGRAV